MTEIDVTERPVGREGLERWYAEALERQAAEGLSTPAMAEELGVTASTLYSWRRRLKEGRVRSRGRSRLPGLVEVAITDDTLERAGDRFVLVLTNDRRIEVPSTYDDDALRRIVGLLESC